MRLFENENIRYLNIQPHNVVFAWTSQIDYEMGRKILLENLDGLEYDEYLLLEGGHCSCYDFDETEWDAIVYTKEELRKLAKSYSEETFWNMIKNYI